MGMRIDDRGNLAPPVASSSSRPRDGERRQSRLALLGNPNTGKTTLFNRLCGVRSKTANFPGSTVEARFIAIILIENDQYDWFDSENFRIAEINIWGSNPVDLEPVATAPTCENPNP